MNKGMQQFVWKHCKTCDRWLIASTMNFHKDKSKKSGLKTQCKDCCLANKKAKEKPKKKKIPLTLEEQKKKKSEYDKTRSVYKKQFYQEHKDYFKNYYQNNKEDILQRRKQHYKDNPEYYFNKNQKRRNRLEESHGKGYVKEQWYEMMEFFNWCCAYSGESLYKNRSIDHIIPVTKNGRDDIWNFVPMVSNYNSCKHNSMPLEWYKQQDYYSEERLQKIVEWQMYAYDKWSTDEDPDLILIIYNEKEK